MTNGTETLPPGAVPNIDALLTPGERSFRKLLLALIIQAKSPLHPAALAAAAGLPTREVGDLINGLQAKGLLVLEKTGSIAFVYPVSALQTSHLVTLSDGSTFFAMCAIDALGGTFEFRQDAAITSVCSHCRTQVIIRLEDGRAVDFEPPGIHALHVNLGSYADWAANC